MKRFCIFSLISILLVAPGCTSDHLLSGIEDSRQTHTRGSNFETQSIVSTESTAFVPTETKAFPATAESENSPARTTTTASRLTTATGKSTVAESTDEGRTTQSAATTNAPAIRLDTEVIADEILRLLNEERAALGRCRLSTAPIAHEIAVARAKELQVLWSHYRPDGSAASTIYTEYQYGVINGEIGVPDGNGGWTLVDAYGPAYGSENISNGTTYRAEATNTGIAQSIVEGFKGSPGHWKDLMKAEYSGVGIGVSITDDPCSDFYVDNCVVLTMDKTYG